MRQKSGPVKEPAEKVVKDIRRATRRQFSAEEKIRIVLEGLRGEESIAELCRREGIVQNLYYRWSKDFLMSDAPARVGSRHCLVNDAWRLIGGGDCFRIEGDVAEKKIWLCRLEEIDPLHFARHVTGESQNGRMVAAGFIEAGNQMRSAATCGAGA